MDVRARHAARQFGSTLADDSEQPVVVRRTFQFYAKGECGQIAFSEGDPT